MDTKTVADKPLQRIAYSQKTEEWFKQNADYYIARSNFNFGDGAGQRRDLGVFYDVYNNKFPLEWFKHVTDPLSAAKAENKSFPAKIRPVTILRPNIDLLLGEYAHRPFVYNVENLGESGFNSYMEQLSGQLKQNLTQHFIQRALAEMQAGGQKLSPEQMEQLKVNPPLPEQVKQEFHLSYKDALAVKGQKWLKRTIREYGIRPKFRKMFKHWLIAGEAYSYKNIEQGRFVYEDISPMMLDFDKSSSSDFLEDGEWVVAVRDLTVSDTVDRFYDRISTKDSDSMEKKAAMANPTAFFSLVRGLTLGETGDHNQYKVRVYHVQWKGRKKIGFRSYLDMDTFQYVEDTVDEDYVVDRERGEQVEWKWVNEVYETWRIHDDIYADMQAVPYQRNPLNHHSSCKLNYNGRKFSDMHSQNTSVMEMGLPFQIMYIIVTFILEKTIAKSKGKILLMDVNAIPDSDDWDDEKFFYYSEALGYGMLDRNQAGVDKTWNQYQVIDMGLFDQIKELIGLQQHFKQEWDDILGISRQRKGQTMSSDGQGVNERAVFQSTVMTDMIFLPFEEFTERELQGIMDFGKFLTASGDRSMYNDDELGTMLLEIFPEDFPNGDLGVFVDSSSDHLQKLKEAKGYAQAMLQNGVKTSTMLEVIDSVNISELKSKLKRIEEIEEEIAQGNAASEQEAQAELEEIRKMHEEFKVMLETRKMHEEYDRKEDIEHIRGSYNTFTFQDGDANDNGVPDAMEVQKMLNDKEKLAQAWIKMKEDRAAERQESDRKEREFQQSIVDKKNDFKLKQEKLKIDRKKASQKPKSSK
jgi:hypothetical protein